MANLDAPSGARPLNRDGSPFNSSTRDMTVDASNSVAIFNGDLVAQEADGNVVAATGGATEVIIGTCVGVVVDRAVSATENVGYLPALTAGTIRVANAESCYFAMQEDGVTSQLTAADRGARINMINGGGSTTTGRSGMELDSDSVGQDATYQLQLVDLVNKVDNAYGAHAEWIVKVNLPQDGQATAGI